MSIGKKLKNLRSAMRWTLKQKSEVFGVSLNTVYRWEHDLAIPRKSVLERMANYYGVAYEWLANENSSDDKPEQACDRNAETAIEQQLLRMFRQLPVTKKHKVLGYIERIIVECAGNGKENEL